MLASALANLGTQPARRLHVSSGRIFYEQPDEEPDLFHCGFSSHLKFCKARDRPT
jgi:hypothetical protein